jgi:hypothetical protein
VGSADRLAAGSEEIEIVELHNHPFVAQGSDDPSRGDAPVDRENRSAEGKAPRERSEI